MQKKALISNAEWTFKGIQEWLVYPPLGNQFQGFIGLQRLDDRRATLGF